MCAQVNHNENRVLIFSALLASVFAIGGLFFGLLTGSLVIIFDGVYSTVSLLLTLLSLAVSKYIQKPEKKQFPFGKAILEPVVITVKASVILAVVGVSLYSAVIAIFNGGREMDASIATLFGVINVVGCGYAWWYIVNRSRTFSSGLIEAESMQWKMDTLLSVGVTAGFLVAWALSYTSFAGYAVYADPLMMCIISVYFIKVPLDMLKDSMRELLMMPPSEEIRNQVDEGINTVDKQGTQQIKLTGLTKVGRELRVNVDINTQENRSINVEDIEKTRQSIAHQLSTMPFNLRLNFHIAR